jgi:uncharacterized protein (DUF1800 family)
MRIEAIPTESSQNCAKNERVSATPALPVYRGKFGAPQAERLLWRAGFGPQPGEAKTLAKKGLTGAVRALTHPPADKLTGPEPMDDRGDAIAPYDAVGHDHLWWLDRMVRTNRPLVERMTLIWHDWFATSNRGVKSQRQMLDQNAFFRQNWLGSFEQLLLGVTKDPAMLVWLSGNLNTKTAPNENYGRELMELFTLGADPLGGYTEQDVREQARALTGWTNRRSRGLGNYDFHYDPNLHDTGTKVVFGKSGRFDWQDSCRLCLAHRHHASFFVRRLWDYFIPIAPSKATQRGLEKLYKSHYNVRPVVAAILKHPSLYRGPRMVKPPVVYTAGLLRAIGRGVDSAQWARLSGLAGQRLFYPPNVAGWDERRWLDTATFRGRWNLAAFALKPKALDPKRDSSPASATELLARAQRFLGSPALTPATRQVLLDFARRTLAGATDASTHVMVENALRQLIAISPEVQTA